MSGYKERRRLSADTLRRLCDKNNWYTGGDKEEYDRLLIGLAGSKDNLETKDIIEIAEDIAEHSVLSDGQDIGSIAFEVNRACTVTFEKPPEGGMRCLAVRRELDDETRKQGIWVDIDGKAEPFSLHITEDGEVIITDNADYSKIYSIESLDFYCGRMPF